MKPIADLHCHPSLKPNRFNPKKNIWEPITNLRGRELYRLLSIRKGLLNESLKNMSKKSQSNLLACEDGQNTLIFISLYPIERPFITLDRPFKRKTKVGRSFASLLLLLNENNRSLELDSRLIALVTGFDYDWIRNLLEETRNATVIDYYLSYVDEYDFLVKSIGNFDGTQHKFLLVNNFNELSENTRFMNPGSNMLGILNIEGIHSLAKYNKTEFKHHGLIDTLSQERQNELEANFNTNIDLEKRKEFPPYYITFCHHFNNLLAGHARTFGKQFFLLFDQTPGLDLGFSKIGLKIIDRMLDRTIGKRILIDIKHMSIQSRIDLYNHLDNNYVTEKSKNDSYFNVPIISSHSAINGHGSFLTALKHIDGKKGERRSYVSRFRVNLNDDDIRKIFLSDGLIGICMHDGRMPGRVFIRRLNRLKYDNYRRNRLHVQMFLANVFHVVCINREMVNKQTGVDIRESWKTVCLGTDNDGIVNPFDGYSSAADLKYFKRDCINYLDHYDDSLKQENVIPNIKISHKGWKKYYTSEIKYLLAGYTPQEAMDLVFYTNTERFLKKYFTEEYLSGNRDH